MNMLWTSMFSLRAAGYELIFQFWNVKLRILFYFYWVVYLETCKNFFSCISSKIHINKLAIIFMIREYIIIFNYYIAYIIYTAIPFIFHKRMFVSVVIHTTFTFFLVKMVILSIWNRKLLSFCFRKF